jgi:hypothetical protein
MLQQAIVDLTNEYRQLQRQLESKTQQLDALTSTNAPGGQFPTDFSGARNRRYTIEYTFEAGDLNPQERSVNVEGGTIFRCAYVESFVQAVGQGTARFTDPPQAVTVFATLPWDSRLSYFDFLWRIRDTGTDREWCDQFQPSLFLGGGYVEPMWFPRRAVLGGGTTLFAELQPIVSASTDVGVGFFTEGAVNTYRVKISFVGHEVPDRSAL